jgi:putative sigma-54 modulation protein
MRIDIKARKVAVSDDLRMRVEKRFDKIAKQVSPLARLEVELSEDPHPRVANSQIAEVTLHLKGTTLRARESAANMVTAVNEAADDIGRQVKRVKEKRSHRRDAAPMVDMPGVMPDVATPGAMPDVAI